MSADSTRSGQGRRSRGLTEHEYVVFLSFRGSDTRKDIAGHLYTGLVDAGSTMPIFMFSEADDRPMGSQFGSQHRKSTGHVVMPLFYRVEPLHVQNLRGSFDKACRSHEMCFERRDVEAGQQALRDVSFFQGWESEKIVNGHQGEFERIVVETVLTEFRQGFLVDVSQTLVGIDDHMKKIMGLLDSTGTRTIGIYGMVGIGKIIFTFGEFAHRSFLPDIQQTIDHSSR